MRTSVTDGQTDRQCGFQRDSRWVQTKRFLEPPGPRAWVENTLPHIQEIGRWTPAFPLTRVPPQIKCKKRGKIFGDVDRRLEDWKTGRFP